MVFELKLKRQKTVTEVIGNLEENFKLKFQFYPVFVAFVCFRCVFCCIKRFHSAGAMSSTVSNRPLSKEALAAIPVLRSLIISEKGTSTLKRILNDYCKEEGEPLPFRKFGFPSAVEYLKATDEFVLRTHMGETTIFVKPKADTAHIQKMVAAQKPAKVLPKRNSAYHWKNPQLRFSSQTGYMPKPLPMQKHFGSSTHQKNPNNPLNRFFPTNSSVCYPKIASAGNEYVPPKPTVPPKVVPSLTTLTVPYAAVIKMEPRETKPEVMNNENVPPLPVTVTQQAWVRPMPNNNFIAKRENPLAGLPMQSAPKDLYFAQNQNPFQNDRFVQQPKNVCAVPSQQNQFSTNPFNLPPGFDCTRPPPPLPPKQFTPSNNFNIPQQDQNTPYMSNPFRTNYQPAPPQQQQQQQQQFPNNNALRNPFGLLQQAASPPPPSPTVISLLDQQVQMLHDSVKSFKNSYQQSRDLLQTKLNQEVEMMEAIVRQYQRSVTDQQRIQQEAVDRLNQQLELLHATCRANQ